MKRLVAVLAYYLGIDALFYLLNRKAKRIVTFHNVIPDDLLSRSPSVGVTECVSEFTRKIDLLSRIFRFSTDVNDAKTLTITFDDGILNEYEVAGRILIERGIPAVLFVSGDVIGMTPDTAVVIDKVNFWSDLASEDDFEKAFGVRGLTRVERWQKYVQPGYRADAENKGRRFLARIEEIRPLSALLKDLDPEYVRLRLSGVKESHLAVLRNHGWLIGWHTKSHFPLGLLSVEERRKELDAPVEYRNVVLGYPYGDIASVGPDTLCIAQDIGYPSAVSNDPNYSAYRGVFFKQRLAISADHIELHFVLSGFKYFLQSFRMLPRI